MKMKALSLILTTTLLHQAFSVIIEQPTSDEVFNVKVGDSGTNFASTFLYETGENAFANPFHWEKCQLTEAECKDVTAPYTLISNSASFQGVFQDKFSITYPSDPNNGNRYTVTLSWQSGVQAEDSGVYRFKVDGSPAVYKHFTLNVLSEIDSVTMTATTNDQTIDQMNAGTSNTIIFVEDKDTNLVCESIGGYPEPTLQLYVGEDLKSGSFQTDINQTLIGTTDGLKKITIDKKIFMSNFRVSNEDNDKVIKCVAKIEDDTGSVVYEKQISKTAIIYYEPIFGADCSGTFTMPQGEASVMMDCTVKARPSPTSIKWVRKAGGSMTTDTEIESNTGIRDPSLNVEATHTTSTNTDETQMSLTFYDVNVDQYGQYDLIVENRIGSSILSIAVSEGELSASSTNSAVSTQIGFLCLIISITFTLLRIC